MGTFRQGDRLLADVVNEGGKTAHILAVKLVDDTGADSDFALAIGDPSDEAWDGEAPDATVISLLKAIALNTAPAAP